ncbi:serine/threonine protein phosphatase [Kitasatospora sp. MMS16-BH015]|uniref:PP2C family protein-serine/threonine phosphatase n=1 Tax=Kitasatospora sp. MMS16-BH015 TaxID=2018025 RepID=UPI000CA18705|nr:PP2C family protein-serine/threonine phosphatase [Kitasatospora sp. MMS16-BH015]AUG75276.1 serine/threonine protein phosphatase [Kitasatospora sp. MMS16-BH015]
MEQLSRRSRGLLAGAYLLLVLAVVTDLLTGPTTTVSPVLASVPVLAASGTRRVHVPLIAGAIALATASLLWAQNGSLPSSVHLAAIAAIAATTLASGAHVAVVTAREQELRQVRSVAEAAQLALLRPVPARLGPLRIAVRYQAAAPEAQIGGDLYEALDTPFGVRVLLGDVEGKGLGAVETAADVLGAFREAAVAEPDLATVAERLDAAVARRAGEERFVTAVLLAVPPAPHPALLVTCGHPPPLLLTRTGQARELLPTAPSPPLGLLALTGGHYTAEPFDLRRGELLLLYTDGLSESRDTTGTFYPLATRLTDLPVPNPEALLDHLITDVTRYTGGLPTDDSALIAIRRDG